MADNNPDLQPDPMEPANPQADWGEALPEAEHGGNHAYRGERPDQDHSQGAQTRKANKDSVSRRA